MNEQTEAIAVKELSKSFSGRHVLRDVSFSTRRGEIVGLLGPNGAGKSTSMKILTGLLDADSGSARVFNQRFEHLDRPSSKVGVMIDPSWLDPSLSGVQTLIASSYSLGKRMTKREAKTALEPFGLANVASKRVGDYSLGMRQRLALCRSMKRSVSLLVLDEPSNGLDVDGVTQLRTFLRSFAARGGSVLLSSHLMSEMQLVADRAIVLSEGHTAGVINLGEALHDSGVTLVSVAEGVEDFFASAKEVGVRVEEPNPESSEWRAYASASDTFKLAVRAGATLSGLRAQGASLEDRYNDLLGK